MCDDEIRGCDVDDCLACIVLWMITCDAVTSRLLAVHHATDDYIYYLFCRY